jgi:hypothetical protein
MHTYVYYCIIMFTYIPTYLCTYLPMNVPRSRACNLCIKNASLQLQIRAQWQHLSIRLRPILIR